MDKGIPLRDALPVQAPSPDGLGHSAGIPSADGWIAHDGGDCPCNPTEAVEIVTKGGDVSQWPHASSVIWRWDAYIAEIHATIPQGAQVAFWRPKPNQEPTNG